MGKANIYQELDRIGQEACQDLGYELVEVVFKPGKDLSQVLYYIHKDSGVLIDDCVSLSRKVEEEIDRLDLIEGAYNLEVSSPGLDRPLKSLDDYRRNKGKLVEVHLYGSIGGQKDFQGVLKDYDEDKIVLGLEEEDDLELPRKSISMMRQAIIF